MFLLGYTLRQFDLRTITKVARVVQHLRRKKFTLDGNGPLSRMPGMPLIPILSATSQHSSSDMDSGVAGAVADEITLRNEATGTFRPRCGFVRKIRHAPGLVPVGIRQLLRRCGKISGADGVKIRRHTLRTGGPRPSGKPTLSTRQEPTD